MAYIFQVQLPDGTIHDIIPGDDGTIQSGDVLTATVLINPISGTRSFSYNWETPQSGDTSKVKIYYVLSDGQYGEWSGQDYSTYNFSDAAIYEENDNTSNTVSTDEIYTEISNGTLVILEVYDPNDCPVYCFPSVVGDDASWMNFSATYTTMDDTLVTLNLTMDITEYSSCNGFYSLPGGSDLPSVTSSDNGKVLMVVNGVWTKANLPIYDGSVTIT